MSREEEGRGGGLTGLLVGLGVDNLGRAADVVGIVGYRLFRDPPPSLPGWETLAWGTLSLANIVFVIAAWHWRKWGVYGLVASSPIVAVFNIGFGLPMWRALLPLAGAAVLIFLLRRRWRHFD